MARPKKLEGALVSITVKVTKQVKEEIERIAAQDARAAGQVARFAVEDGLEVIKAKGLRTNGRRRRGTVGADVVVRAASSRRAALERFNAARLPGNKRRERDSGAANSELAPDDALDPRPAA